MPGFDGTGPVGRGARTGRGLGNCDLPERNAMPYGPSRPGFGFSQRPRLGLGFRRGWGGRGRCFW